MSMRRLPLRLRGALAFLLALSPLIAAVIANGSLSFSLWAAFTSGCLFSVAVLAYVGASVDSEGWRR
jgi:hypothetical protein